MADVDVVVTPGLGDNSYLIRSRGEAALVDPQRDVARFLALAEERGVRILHVLETHVHNDYVSGALDVAGATGADIVAPAGGGYAFPHRPVAEGDGISVGDHTLSAMETPGHTPEHTSYALSETDTGRTVAVFTGGSLMVGGAGRTDLAGPSLTDGLTRAQFRTLRRLGALPGDVRVYPTHGAGSFCGAGPAPRERTSTMGEEVRTNGALGAPDEEAFVQRQLSGLLAFPTYYASMAPINRAGPSPVRDVPRPRPLDAGRVADLQAGGAWVIDARPRVPFAGAHIPGSVNVELDDSFGSYAGWVVPFGRRVALVLPAPEEVALEAATVQLLRIGYDRVEGYLEGGMAAWRAAGRPVSTYPVAGMEELCRSWRTGGVGSLLDVRQRVEWDRGHVPGSRHLFVGDVPARIGDLPGDRESWVICASGHRASVAASLLDRAGLPVRLVGEGGVVEFLARCGGGGEPW